MSDLKENPTYEQPKLTNYGTMKSLTLGLNGSGSDAQGSSNGGDDPLQDNSNSDGGATDPNDVTGDAHDGTGAQADATP